jgi:hypothetical protein
MAFKKTSQLLNLGSTLDLVDGTPASFTVSLPLNTLDREIFVVTDIQMDAEPIPVPTAAGNTVSVAASLNKIGTGVLQINNPQCIGSLRRQAQSTALDSAMFQESFMPNESTSGTEKDFITIIATPDYVLSGSFATTAGGAANRAIFARITGYRAKADSDVYAALVTEELNNQ